MTTRFWLALAGFGLVACSQPPTEKLYLWCPEGGVVVDYADKGQQLLEKLLEGGCAYAIFRPEGRR